MKITARLDESDLRQLLATHFAVDVADVTIHHTGPDQDGPHYTPASTYVEIKNPKRLD